MKRNLKVEVNICAALLAGLVVLLTLHAQPPQQSPAGMSPADQKALLERLIANQHRNDAALEQYERTERRVLRPKSGDSTPTEDKMSRVIPTGTGTVRVLLEDSGKPVESAAYRKAMEDAAQALQNSCNPNLPEEQRDEAKAAHRRKERAEFVDAIRDAFIYTFQGRETRDGRTLLKFTAEPNPDYKPPSRETAVLGRVRATAWVDEATTQIVRLEGEVFKDVYFAGGLAGKVYHGSHFSMEQASVATDTWFPTRVTYDVDGRKLFFGFAIHEITDASHYRRIGPPREALATVRREISSGARLPNEHSRSDP